MTNEGFDLPHTVLVTVTDDKQRFPVRDIISIRSLHVCKAYEIAIEGPDYIISGTRPGAATCI